MRSQAAHTASAALSVLLKSLQDLVALTSRILNALDLVLFLFYAVKTTTSMIASQRETIKGFALACCSTLLLFP